MLGVAQNEEDDAIVSVGNKNKTNRKYSHIEDEDDAIVSATNKDEEDDAIVISSSSKKMSKEEKAILAAAQSKPLWEDESRNVYS
jgi:hypothetical protein